jgi:hypothetical protein
MCSVRQQLTGPAKRLEVLVPVSPHLPNTERTAEPDNVIRKKVAVPSPQNYEHQIGGHKACGSIVQYIPVPDSPFRHSRYVSIAGATGVELEARSFFPIVGRFSCSTPADRFLPAIAGSSGAFFGTAVSPSGAYPFLDFSANLLSKKMRASAYNCSKANKTPQAKMTEVQGGMIGSLFQ